MSVAAQPSGWLISLSLLLAFASPAAAQEACFERIDNGTDMTGWHKSTTNHHGPGDGWAVENGAFIGRQTGNQQGGILMTDKSYRDVEVIFEVKITWGCDSGFFFRTTAGDRAYQVNVDHLAESGVGTIYGEGFAQELRAIPYWLTDSGNAAIVAPDQNQTPIFELALWPTLWKPTDFNEIRARVEGNPPHMQVWISGTQVMDFTDTMTRNEIDASGPLAIQVHSGGRWVENGTVEYKNIRVRDLSVPCEDPGSGGAGGGGAGGSGTAGGGAAQAGGGQATGGAGAGGAPSAGSAGSPGSAGSAAQPQAGSAAGGAAPASGTTDDGGCGCRLGAPAGSRLALVAFLGLAAATLGRRRLTLTR